jgi:lysophospholipase L1-like esterase
MYSFIFYLVLLSPVHAENISAYGDSITAGVGASPVSKSWIGLFTPANLAVSGSQAAEVSKAVQSSGPDPDATYTIMIGTNDHRHYKTDTAKQEYFRKFFRQSLAWLALPDKCKGRDTCMTYTGSWGNTVANSFGKVSNQSGAAAEATVSGTAVYVCYILQNHSLALSSASVEIDSVSAGTIGSGAVSPPMNTVKGSTYASACQRYAGLSAGAHDVKITVTSSGKNLYLDYIAGSSQASAPKILVSNIIQMSSAGYSTYGTSLANVNAYNAIIEDVMSEFPGVILIDNFTSIDPVADLADGIHPNNAGHAKINANFMDALQ